MHRRNSADRRHLDFKRTSPNGAGTMDRIVTPRLSKAECGSLHLPAQREVGMLDQYRRGQAGRLSSVEDGGGDVGGEVGEAENLAVVGAVQFLVVGQFGKLAGSPVHQPLVEPVGIDECLDQTGIRFRGRHERIGVIDHHPHFLAGAPQLHRVS